MSELKLKDLKNMLTDNELDLSTQQITTIPVKALSLLPRATCIDFSNNSITKISPEFCQLIHLTKLDFTKNKIIQLPDDFGKLINLTYLDLYKNRIKDLPLSFGNLLNLKWLDLKGNPLESELEKFANECEDEKGYKRTAVRVVQLMQKRAIVQHEMI